MKKTTFVFVAFLVVTAMVLTFISSDIAWSSDRSGRPHQGGLFRTNGTPVSSFININNVAGWIRNDGWSARDPGTGNAGVYFPRGTSTVIYQDGIVWGGNVNDGGAQVLRVGGQTYSIGTVAGRIISAGHAASANDPDVRIYRIRRDWQTADLRQDAAELNTKSLASVTDGDVAAVRAQYETDWNEWPASQGAPYYDRDSNGVYNPAIDEPGIADADQVIWFVCNDLDPGKTNALYGSNPIGMELQVTLWGYNRTDPLANVYFKKFTFIYKGTATTAPGSTITDMYACQWSDPDLGDSGDDFAGCDTTLSMAYVYNGGPNDNEFAKFGLKPPAVGYDFLQGPIVNGAPTDSAVFGLHRRYGKKNLPMTAAFYFAAGGTYSDPPFSRQGTDQWYNLLRGLTPITGAPFAYPGSNPSTFWLDGDPAAAPSATNRIDGTIDQPGDRRIGACSGPFTMALGDTQEIVVGVVAGIGADYLNSITVMKNNDVAVQSAYDALFDLPKAPPAPNVHIAQLNEQLVLDWGSDTAAVSATEGFNKKGYLFEGYNVYQVVSAGTAIDLAGDKRNLQGRTDVKLLATYDLSGPQDLTVFGQDVRTIADLVFDSKLGITVPIVKQLGTDNGIVRQLVINTDQIRSAPLVNGQRYYFAVTAFGFNPSDQALTHVLESTPRILVAVPQTPNPGSRIYTHYGEALTVTNTNPGKKSDGVVTSTIIDPTRVTGKGYTVSFQSIDGVTHWYMTTGADTLWRSINQGPTVLIDPENGISGNLYDYPIVDGMFVTVSGPPPLLNADRTSFTGTRWWTGSGRFTLGGPGADVLRDEATTAFDMTNYLGAVGSTLDPSQYVDVEFRFGAGGSLTQKAYRYSRAAFPEEGGSQYKFMSYDNVPFQVWDVSNPSSPRQLNVGWRDNDLNGIWDPNGNVEIIFVAKSTYDGDNPTTFTYGTTLHRSTNNIVHADVMYVAEWISRNGVASDITATTIHISPNYVNSAADVFAFTAPAAQTYAADAAKADVTRINVFPNPYYGFNRAETSRLNRFVTFNHMPPSAEVRIFNLAGALVRVLVKADPTQYFTWDLNNQQGLPVASGIYIAYMTLKDAAGTDLGTKTLKLVVIQEQQYLDNF